MLSKSAPDMSRPEATYEIPANIAKAISEIETAAKDTYPDHAESRICVVRQTTLALLSEKVAECERLKLENEKLHQRCCDAAEALIDWHQKLVFPLAE